MGGAIGVDSREGQGSTFWFTAVFDVAPPGQRRRRRAARADGSRATAERPCTARTARILVAEDNATNRQVALAQLQKLGYQASAVANGAEAVEAVRQGRYDLVLMDCEMPVMDGFEATRRIRESSHPVIPIVALTAHAMPADRDRCLSAGMNDYLSKPVELERLAEVLAKWLPAGGAGGATKPDAVTSAGEPAQAVFNPEALLRRLMGDRQLAGIVLRGSSRMFPPSWTICASGWMQADAAGVRLQAHALKGAAATVAAEGLRAVALAMERAGTDGQLDRCGELLPRAVEEFQLFRSALDRAEWI